MKAKIILCWVNLVLSVKSQEFFQTNGSKYPSKYFGIFSYDSIVDKLGNFAEGSDLKGSVCIEELIKIRKGVENSEVWAFKGK